MRRRYSTQPTSPLGPMLLFPYPNGLGGPAFSFSESGKEKKLTASDSSLEMNSVGTPWLITLKNPNSSQALTRRFFESGFDRSMMGIPEKNVVVSLQVLMADNCSIAGLARTTMVGEDEDGEEKGDSKMGSWNMFD